MGFDFAGIPEEQGILTPHGRGCRLTDLSRI